MAKRSTVIDVAESAGVGASTVSRHLRGITVRPKLAERIEKAVRELDYEPDETARSLRGGRSRTIGVLFPKVSNAYFSHALQRIEELASEQGYTVALLTHHNDPKEQLNDLLTLRRCRAEGVIITAMPGTTLQDIRAVLLVNLSSLWIVSFHRSWTQCFFRIDSLRLMPLGIFSSMDTRLWHALLPGREPTAIGRGWMGTLQSCDPVAFNQE